MRTFKSIMTGAALAGATALLPIGASAEGLPSSGRTAAPYSWTGFYAGVNLGQAWGDADVNSRFSCPDDNCGYLTQDNLDFFGAIGTGSLSTDGFTGGVQVGYNWQSGSTVVGLELDYGALNLGVDGVGVGVVPAGAGQLGAVGVALSTDWLFTLRGRVGALVTPSVLVYATGGLAVTEINVANFAADNFSTVSPGSNDAFGASARSETKVGYTVGAGLEWALDSNWTIRGEYLYLDFGSVSTSASVATDPTLTPNVLDSSADLTAHVGRAAINYKF